MNDRWQLQEAKNKLSQVIDQALAQGPQMITRRGKPAAVVLSVGAYAKIKAARTQPQKSLVDVFRQSPLVGLAEFKLERPRDLPREGFLP